MSSGLELLQDGLLVMCIGMGIVITFLVIMVFAIEIMHKIIEKLNVIFPPEVKEEVKKVAKAKRPTDEEQIAIAIAASRV
jgi:sodium pump decarboxylase gamma subunit